MYDKKQINFLFKRYVETKDDKVFEQLIVACDGMIDAVLSKCENFSSYFEDLKQEVRLKMWADIRKNSKLSDYLTNPHSYLLFRVRRFINGLLDLYAQTFDIKRSLSDQEETAIELIDEKEADFDAVAGELNITPARAKEIYYAGKRKKQQHDVTLVCDLHPAQLAKLGAVVQNKYLDPEKQYLLKEILRTYHKKVKQKLSSHTIFGKDRKKLERVLSLLDAFFEENMEPE